MCALSNKMDGQTHKLLSILFTFIGFSLSLMVSPLMLAQHDVHGISNHDAINVVTMPANNEILSKAPQSLMLNFKSAVRLVKLAVKETVQGEILIDFRYDPAARLHYSQPLPILADANFYKVEWAAINGSGELVKGSFYFSFGDNARPASHYRDHMDHQMQITSPDYRLL